MLKVPACLWFVYVLQPWRETQERDSSLQRAVRVESSQLAASRRCVRYRGSGVKVRYMSEGTATAASGARDESQHGGRPRAGEGVEYPGDETAARVHTRLPAGTVHRRRLRPGPRDHTAPPRVRIPHGAANLPQYQEQREKNCATGVTAEGKAPKTLVEEMVPLLDSRDVGRSNMNKVRIIALYIQHRDGVPDEDRRRLYQHARLTLAEQDAVNALVHLGVRISRQSGDKDTRKKMKQKPSNEEEYELSRYKPVLRTVLEEHVSNKLDPTLFPGGATHQDTRQRILVFVAGGMTYSEMREAYLLSKSLNKEIIIGSTHALTPSQFVDDLKVLEIGGVGSRALPNGLGETNAPARSAQEIYDQKFFTRDAPPPQRAAPAPSPQAQEKGRFLRPSPVPSFSSSQGSATSPGAASYGGEKETEKKKKHRFLRF
ncbi:Sec1-like protein [Trametes polyzona]|nr:Sec1-like protein [Trametes polyzona]